MKTSQASILKIMMAPTHLVFGVTAAFGLSHLGLLEASVPVFAAASLGSLLPDIDHPGSVVGRRLWLVSMPVSMIFGHRGITHSLIAVVAMSAAIAWQIGAQSWIVALAIGYLTHLIGDWLTPSGVPFLWPNRRKFSSPIGFKTNSMAEMVCLVAMIAADAYGLWG